MDLMHRDGGRSSSPNPTPRASDVVGLGAPSVIGAPRIVGLEPQAATPVALPPATPREEFDAGMTALKGGQFESAEEAFKTFLRKHPKDRLVADATFYLGESYYKRQRSREAAENYLKVSTDYEKSSRAPEALLKLGLSLEKLGAREQACAAYGEVGRKYPTASASLRASAERESKRSQC
jgi:tol-pal system protein YbgF